METVLTRKAWVKPTRKLTDEEIQELIDNFDYEDWLADSESDEDTYPAVWDSFGNPTRDMIAAKYEVEHGLLEGPMTIEEFFAELDMLREEADNETN